MESGGNDEAKGDYRNGKPMAIGCLQVWKIYWQDATEFSKIGGTYTDCFKREYAKRVLDAYMRRYAKEAWTCPEKFNAEKVSRIHNGGPKGYRKTATLKYWAKVKAALLEGQAGVVYLPGYRVPALGFVNLPWRRAT